MPQNAPNSALSPSATEAGQIAKDVVEFLVEWAVAAGRYRVYPPGHPSLEPAVGDVMLRLVRVLEERGTLGIGVARDQLLVDGCATQGSHPLLSELAARLHDHHLGAVTFTLDVDREAISGLLTALAADPEEESELLGLRAARDLPAWSGVRLMAVGYEDLRLEGEDDSDGQASLQALDLWIGLARLAMAGRPAAEADLLEDDPDPEAVAQHLREPRDAAFDDAIAGFILQIADRVSEAPESSGPLRDRISSLINGLDRETLERILHLGGDAQRRRHLVRRAYTGLGGPAALKILRSAAASSGQELSVLMVRMLTKLSFHADQGGAGLRPKAARVVRRAVDDLLDGWDLEDPNPEGYVRILDELSRASPYLKPRGKGLEFRSSALTLLKASIEVGTYGPMVDEAIDELVTSGGLPLIAPLVEEDLDNQAVQAIRARIASPDLLMRLEDLEQVSDESLEILVQFIGPEVAVPRLLRILAESPSRSLRRTVFDRLLHCGDHIGKTIKPFLEDPRWYVVRNMLGLVAALPEQPAGFTALPYVTHPDQRVRRAALPLALEDPVTRSRAITTALRESDERMVRVALLELAEAIPEALVPLVARHCVANEEMSLSLRALAVRVLARSRLPEAREALLSVAVAGRSFFGRPRLATLEGTEGEFVKEALRALAAGWPEDSRVAPVLKVAWKSRDPSVLAVLTPVKEAQDAQAGAQTLQDLWSGRA